MTMPVFDRFTAPGAALRVGHLAAGALLAAAMASAAACASRSEAPVARLRVALSFPAAASGAPLDGRLLLLLSTDGGQEPRLQITDNDQTQQVFGADVEQLRPGQDTVFDAAAPGYPVTTLAKIPAGEYWVQGLLHVYGTFTRSDGHAVKLPPDRGEGPATKGPFPTRPRWPTLHFSEQ